MTIFDGVLFIRRRNTSSAALLLIAIIEQMQRLVNHAMKCDGNVDTTPKHTSSPEYAMAAI